jgi:gliding motility-associated-like protein
LMINAAGTYWVDVTLDGCKSRDSITIGLLNKSSLSLGRDTAICLGDSIRLGREIALISSYQWSTGDTIPKIVVLDAGLYILTVTNSCGVFIDSITVSDKNCSCLEVIPTAFSPNGDGVNDSFRFFSTCPLIDYSMHIYNRWGQLVYSTTLVTDSWDGAYEGQQQPLGVYAVSVSHRISTHTPQKYTVGTVTLIR